MKLSGKPTVYRDRETIELLTGLAATLLFAALLVLFQNLW
jgi:hypothetical protein